MADGNMGNFLATDRVPDTIFGIPVVSRREDYTRADLAFFRDHPEAGGYYDMGEGGPDPAEGPVQASGGGRSFVPGNTKSGREFSLQFERTPKAGRRKDGAVVYYPEQDRTGAWDIGGYRYWWNAKAGRLVRHANGDPVSEATYRESVRRTDADIDRVAADVYRVHGVEGLPEAYATATRDLVFAGGGETLRRERATKALGASPKFHGIVRKLAAAGVPRTDAFGIALLLEQDSYGATNYRRFAARGGLVADELSRSADPVARSFADAYRRGWEAKETRGNGAAEEDAFGTNWAKHAAGMREAAKVANSLGLVYSARREK